MMVDLTYSLLMLICGLLHIVMSEQECLYQYLRQPPSEVECNPYSTSDSLAIQCQISIPVASSAEIRWFHDDSLITQDSFPLLESIMVEDATSNRVITSTIVFDESSFGDQYSGEYYCKMVVNGNVYESSNTLELLREDHYIFYNPCTENDVAVSEAVRCVQSSVPTVASPVTLTTAVTTPGGTTNQPSSAPPPASSSSSSRAPPSPSPSSSALPLVTSMPTTTVGIPAASTAAAPALWMYILIALVVALVLITISMATGVGILCHQVRTEDVSQKDKVQTSQTRRVSSKEGGGGVPLKEADVVSSHTNSYRIDPTQQAYDLTRHASVSSAAEHQNHYDVAHPDTQQGDHVGIELGWNTSPYANVQVMQC